MSQKDQVDYVQKILLFLKNVRWDDFLPKLEAIVDPIINQDKTSY